jgi:hypothetical protein
MYSWVIQALGITLKDENAPFWGLIVVVLNGI